MIGALLTSADGIAKMIESGGFFERRMIVLERPEQLEHLECLTAWVQTVPPAINESSHTLRASSSIACRRMAFNRVW
jgi:hypothetical protein